MAVTYADLVAFGFAYVENNVSNLKGEKLQVKTRTSPLLRTGDACPCSEEDFVLLAEFSEIKGPVALVTVPFHAQHQSTIDINSFIMRIMSVDYQANPWGHFCICQDTQVLQTNISHDRHAYVHYFTLYDLHARGFVRPMCIAYVSTDHRKLHRLFPKMRKYFLEITEIIKVENRVQFCSEISSALTAIKSFSTIKDEDSVESCNGPCTTSLSVAQSRKYEQLLHQYKDFTNMLQVVKASLVGSEFAKATLDHWRGALNLKDEIVPSGIDLYLKLVSFWACPSRASFKIYDGGCVLDKHLRPMPSLSPFGTACALWRLYQAVKMFNHCELSTSLGSFPTLSSSMCEMHTAENSDPDSAWEALAQPEFVSLVESLASGALEATAFNKEDHTFTKEGMSGNEGSSSYHSLSDSTGVNTPVENVIQNASIITLVNGSSELSCGGAEVEDLSKSSWRKSCSTISDDSLSLNKSQFRDDYDSILGSCSTVLSINGEPSDKVLTKIALVNNSEAIIKGAHDEHSENSSSDSESFHDILEVLHGDENWSLGSSDDEQSLGGPWNHCLWTQYRPVSKPGHRLLQFFWTFRSAAQHVVYSLLMGRTLVLTGDARSERRVSRIINALSPLIPPLDSNGLRVLRWHQGILVSAHIARYQVIGMCIPERLSIHDMISPRDKNSVSILDVNTEQLLGPAYHGHLLAAIGSNVRDFPSDLSVLLFIQSVFSGIGYKLQAYKALITACNHELPSHVCRQLDLHGCDGDMIRYLSKLPS